MDLEFGSFFELCLDALTFGKKKKRQGVYISEIKMKKATDAIFPLVAYITSFRIMKGSHEI